MTDTPIITSVIRRNLLRWYRSHARDLPWRRSRDPYAIWISEIMLQQTQVDTVIPYFERFVKRFPTVQKLAGARLDSVLKLWEGLGYYSRARNMHRTAQVVCKEYGGGFPDTAKGLQNLPGIGRYTAGAIASIAFNRAEPLVDGNVARVFCRLFCLRMDPKSTKGLEKLWSVAEELVSPRSPGDFNQALMELGAMVCRPDLPKCEVCPLRRQCLAFANQEQGELPLRKPGKKTPLYQIGVGVIYREGLILIDRRPEKGLLGGLWEFPGGKQEKGESLRETVVRETKEELDIKVKVRRKLMVVDHAYSHFRIRLHVYTCDYVQGEVKCNSCTAFKWVKPAQLGRFAFPTANKKIVSRLLEE